MAQKNVSTGYVPRPLQAQLHRDMRRFSVFVMHRRFGKTVFAVNDQIDRLLQSKHTNPRAAYIAPLLKQAKSVAWDYVQEYMRAIPGVQFNQAELRADLPNGGRYTLYGADNPDGLRGIYLDSVTLDEYGDMSPSLWPLVIRPTLADRKGSALFIGTPKGKNAFYDLYESARLGEAGPEWFAAMFKASETGIIPVDELIAMQREMSDDEYEQELECSFSASIKGAYYANEFAAIDAEKRICRVRHETSKPVETWWDIGTGDATAIWFVQRVGIEIRLIDYYEMTGEGVQHFARVLEEKADDGDWIYSRHIAPHDIKVREWGGNGTARIDTAKDLGLDFEIAPDMTIEDGRQAVRTMLSRCWFDEEKCRHGIEALRHYRKKWDDRLKVFSKHHLHDWSSHCADAFRYGAVSHAPNKSWGKPLAINTMGVV